MPGAGEADASVASAAIDVSWMLSELMRASHIARLEDVPGLVTDHAEQAGLGAVRIYVADVQQKVLRELTGHGLDAGQGGQELSIDSTLPGRCFQAAQLLRTHREGGTQRWVPVLDGTERLGVLRIDTDAEGDAAEKAMYALASLVGLMLPSKRMHSDAYALLTRLRATTVPAEMQWSLIPPKTFANDRLLVSAVAEPAYEVAGDAFDYAEANGIAHLAIFDASGHDTAAGVTSNLTVAAYRSSRRRPEDLPQRSRTIESFLAEQLTSSRYTTAVLAELDLGTGMLSWINHGHPPPVLIRNRRTVITLDCPASTPLGMGFSTPVTVCRHQLEPGDRLLLHTDGITEARNGSGEEFGLSRFADFIVRHDADGLPVPETLRRLIREVMAYNDGQLQDDATVLLCEWNETTRDRLEP